MDDGISQKAEVAHQGHILLLDVAAYEPLQEHLATLLNSEERARAGAFAVPGARKEFVVSRGVLRLLLAERLRISPQQVQFQYGNAGKPALRDAAASECWFNLSHSHGVVAICLSDAGEVGIDVEWVNPDTEVVELAETAWGREAAVDLKCIENLEERRLLFFQQWVRFEAEAKQQGCGLTYFGAPTDGSEFLQLIERSVWKRQDLFVYCAVLHQDARPSAGTWLQGTDVLPLLYRYG